MADEVNLPDPVDPLNQNNQQASIPPIPEIAQLPSQPSYAQVPPPYPQLPPPYMPQPKKSKAVKWIVIAVVASLLMCGLGIGGIAYFAVSKTGPAFDYANKFMKSATTGEELDDYICSSKPSTNFEQYMEDGAEQLGEITSYDFDSYEKSKGEEIISGEILRDGTLGNSRSTFYISLIKEDGDYKVCALNESAGLLE